MTCRITPLSAKNWRLRFISLMAVGGCLCKDVSPLGGTSKGSFCSHPFLQPCPIAALAETREKCHIAVGELMGQEAACKKLDQLERDNLDWCNQREVLSMAWLYSSRALFPALEQRKMQKSFLCHLVALHRAHVWQRPVKWENIFPCATEHPHGSHDVIFPNISIWAFSHSYTFIVLIIHILLYCLSVGGKVSPSQMPLQKFHPNLSSVKYSE